LAAETRWDWMKRYPVIRIDFSYGVLHGRAELTRRIQSNLRRHRVALELPRPAQIDPDDVVDDLADLIEQAHRQHGWRTPPQARRCSRSRPRATRRSTWGRRAGVPYWDRIQPGRAQCGRIRCAEMENGVLKTPFPPNSEFTG
jgi:hypothetical protein